MPDRWVSQEASTLLQHVVLRRNGMLHLAIIGQALSRCFLPYVGLPPSKDRQPTPHAGLSCRGSPLISRALHENASHEHVGVLLSGPLRACGTPCGNGQR
jgi:hypothetical protein